LTDIYLNKKVFGIHNINLDKIYNNTFI